MFPRAGNDTVRIIPARTIETKRNEGFTLIETLAAMAILVALLLSILTVLPVGYQQITKAGRMEILNHLGQEKIDFLKSITDYDDDDLADGIHPSTGLGETFPEFPHDTESEMDSDYSVYWRIDENVPETDMKTINVFVGYRTYEYASGTAISEAETVSQLEYTFQTVIIEAK